jgi:hypothetical protein
VKDGSAPKLAGAGRVGRAISLWAPPVLTMAVIFALSHQPGLPAPAGLGDKEAHAITYATLAAFFVRALAGGGSPSRTASPMSCISVSLPDARRICSTCWRTRSGPRAWRSSHTRGV